MTTPGRAAPAARPAAATRHTPAPGATAPQSWMVRVVDARYHWPELLASLGGQPALPAPVGAYLRRMQAGLDAATARRSLLLTVTRPRVRFDVTGMVQWGYFSLKLTLPLLLGATAAKEHITVELSAPPGATVGRPGVVLSDNYISLNWGAAVEVFSVHDLLRLYGHNRLLPGKVTGVGQAPRPPAADGDDSLLLAIDTEVAVHSAAGAPARHGAAAAALQAERATLIEAALSRYFEGSTPRQRSSDERQQHSARLVAIQAAHHLVQYTIDLHLPRCGSYRQLCSEFVTAAERHLLSCFIADGQAQVAAMPFPPR